MTTRQGVVKVSGYFVCCAMLSVVWLAYGTVAETDEYPDEDPVELEDETVQQLNEAVGGRSVNFVLNFVEEDGAIVPAAAGKKLIEIGEPTDIVGKPVRLIFFVDDNDKFCVQKPSGELKCYESS